MTNASLLVCCVEPVCEKPAQLGCFSERADCVSVSSRVSLAAPH
jgi:hypothetical protein